MPSSRFEELLGLIAPRLPGDSYAVTLRSGGAQPRVLFVGGALEALTGLDALSFGETPERWTRSVHPEDADALATSLRSVEDSGGGSVEYRIVAGNGGVRWLREDLSVLPGDPIELFGLVRDVSGERRLVEAIDGLEERLWQAQRMESLGALLSGVAYDFNDLLTTILATAPLVGEERGLSGVSRANLRIVEGAAARGSSLVKQIIEFSTRPREGARVAHVSALARGLEPVLARVLGKRYRINVRSEERLWLARCNPVEVEQVIFNLIMNARDAMLPGGDITVGSMNTEIYSPMAVEGGVLPPGRYVHLVVADGGSGIAKDDRERLFKRHYTTKPGRGAGFGLWTVQRIVRGCGGGLTVESDEGEGSTFHVYLPCDQAGVYPLDTPVSPQAKELRSGLRILIVDDDALVGGVIERSLVRDGHSVVVAKSLGRWIPTLGGPNPAFNLLIVDVGRLEEGGDLDALNGPLSSLPVIFTSRLGERALDRHEGLHQRGVFLPKPVEPTVLRDAVARAAIGDSSRPTGSEYQEALGG